ncbi:MAG TPA: TonB-dependent receptor [Opitutaceae bacterium]|nr:TonB-dependent receptor [Opitutaceae bacterium]
MSSFRLFPFCVLLAAVFVRGQSVPPAEAPAPAAPAPADPAVTMDPFDVSDHLDRAREGIQPELGASSFVINKQQLLDLPQGADAPFSQVLLRAPGVAEDSAANGDLHVRGEHGNLQYRINDVLLPEGISGFGLELDPRFVGSMQLVTGSLPAQYGFRTAGVVDIQTKSGALDQGGGVSLYGGSFNTLRPSFELGGATGRSSYFIDGSYDHNDLGIENPTGSARALHDTAGQGRLFSYFSRILDNSSRVSVMLSASDSRFQVPDTPGLAAGTSPNGTPWLPGSFDSSRLDENQRERNYFGVVTWQAAAGNLNYQVSALARASSVHFTPDPVGDLYFNGVASDVDRQLRSGGLQADASYPLGDRHTLRFGGMFLDESVSADASTTVFPTDADGNATGAAFTIADNHNLHGQFAGGYVQDEWKLTPKLTLNYGARIDAFDSSFDREAQLSPRLNLLYQPAKGTTLHAGYARYFTPPPVENVSGATVAKFDGTSNASAIDTDDPVRAERADYFDAGVSQKFGEHFQVGLDGYYKRAKNQLDDGLFGQTLILSAFNYARGEIKGVELSSSYSAGGFTAYANLAHSEATGRDWISAQFLFDPADLAYVRTHAINLDHDQTLTGTFGTSYTWKQTHGSTLVYLDLPYGSGLRNDATAADGTNIPNGGTVPAYYTLNVGVEQDFRTSTRREWKVRVDLVNLADKSYELRDGSGVGVNAAQYGMRRGLFGSVSYTF